jgi:hypothetical protein
VTRSFCLCGFHPWKSDRKPLAFDASRSSSNTARASWRLRLQLIAEKVELTIGGPDGRTEGRDKLAAAL